VQLPSISILLPFHRTDAHLRDAIESIKNSRNVFIQLILIDDRRVRNSDDFSKISKIWTGGVGYAESLNIGKQFADGEYLALMNSDDLVSRDRLRIQARLLRDNECSISVTRLMKFSKNKRPLFSMGGNPRIMNPSTAHFLVGSHLANASWMTPNSFWQQNCKFLDMPIGSDWVLGLNLIQNHKFHYLNQRHYFYRKHTNQITNSKVINLDQLGRIWENCNLKSGGPPLPGPLGAALVFPNHIQIDHLELNSETILQFENWISSFYQRHNSETYLLAKPRIAFLSYLIWRKHPENVKITPHIAALSKIFIKGLLNG
jgi:glycosyltransferase involved in cell wall biosynthesis